MITLDMRILIAPDKFKGSLGARDVAENIACGLREVLPNAKIDVVPMADGGEGTAEVICDALGGKWFSCMAHDPIGREIKAHYGWIANRGLAVMEMSEAAGMWRLQSNERDIVSASTFGVGEMILDASRRGAKQLTIGLGGSATNDGGFGMACSLGFRFFAGERELTGAVADLSKLTRIEPSPGTARPPPPAGEGNRKSREAIGDSSNRATNWLSLSLPKIVAAADVKNPLLGANGATQVFGRQKGATADDIETLERALTRLADVIEKESGSDFRHETGAAAAGGLGFGLMAFCDAKIRAGFDLVAESIGLESKMRDSDVVITGEGSLDRQTLEGKTPAGVARVARQFGKGVFAIVGRASPDTEVRQIFDAVYELSRPGTSDQQAIKHAAELLQERARELAKTLAR
jgi:glycerate kinase